MRVMIAGSGSLGTGIMRRLADSSHEVVGLLLNGQRYRSAYERWNYTSFFAGARDSSIVLAKSIGAPLLWLESMDEASLAPIAALKPDLLITCGFGIILKSPLLELPAVGCINVHSSLLPKHRGPMPFNWVVLLGDRETGVTFHVTTPGIDAGPIVAQYAFPLSHNDTAASVYRKCSEEAARRAVAVVDQIARDGLNGTPQDESAATYDRKLGRADMQIDWRKSAIEIDRLVRTGALFMNAYFTHRSREVIVERVIVRDTQHEASPGTVITREPYVEVACGNGTVSIVDASVQQPVIWPWPSMLSTPTVGEVLT